MYILNFKLHNFIQIYFVYIPSSLTSTNGFLQFMYLGENGKIKQKIRNAPNKRENSEK